jgi:hypothetical protein
VVKRQTNHSTLYQGIQLIQSKQKDLESSVMNLLADDKYFELHLKLSEPVFTIESFFLTNIFTPLPSCDVGKQLTNVSVPASFPFSLVVMSVCLAAWCTENRSWKINSR